MAASSGVARPILAREIINTGTAVAHQRRMLEKSGQTFLQGTPVQVDVAGATGFIIACPTISSVATANIAGFSTEPAANLTTSGVAKTLVDIYAPPNQPSAVIIPVGARLNYGDTGLVLAADETWFVGVYGDSSTAANATLAQAQVGAIRGLTKDAGNSFWYVDNFITTAANGACVEIIELIDPVGTLNGRVMFKVTGAAQQLQT